MNFPVHFTASGAANASIRLTALFTERFTRGYIKSVCGLDFTCPNRDGKVAVGGCIYCNNASHTAKSYQPRMSVTAQLEKGALALQKRHKAEKFIAYFQSYSNTYDDITKLERLYREALEFPGVIGVSIATRPDCLGEDVLELLSQLSRQTYLWLEVGLGVDVDRTLAWVNRGHGLSEYIDAVEPRQSARSAPLHPFDPRLSRRKPRGNARYPGAIQSSRHGRRQAATTST